jgi:hypothetical protein
MGDLTMPGTDNRIGAFNDPVWAVVTWVIHGMRTMAILVLPFAIVRSIRTTQISTTTYLNQGMVNATRVAVYTAALGTIIAAAVFWFVFQSSPLRAVVIGLALGILSGFLSGGADVLGHWCLRPLLSAECGVRLGPFLAWAAEAGLLRRVGGRYVFRHALIAESLAQGWSDGAEADTTARARGRRIHAAAVIVIGVVVVAWSVFLAQALLEAIS